MNEQVINSRILKTELINWKELECFQHNNYGWN